MSLNNSQSPKPQTKWQPKQNSPNNKSKNPNYNAKANADRGKRVPRNTKPKNKSNNVNNTNNPNNTNTNNTNDNIPNEIEDTNTNINNNNNSNTNNNSNNNFTNPYNNNPTVNVPPSEPQKEGNYVLYSVPPPPDASAAYTSAQVPNFFPMLIPNLQNSPGQNHTPLPLEHVKDQIFSLLGSSPNSSTGIGINNINNMNNMNNINNMSAEEYQRLMNNPPYPFPPQYSYGSPISPPFLQFMNNGNAMMGHIPFNNIPQLSPNTNAKDNSTFPPNMIPPQNLQNNMTNNGLLNTNNPFAHMNSNFPPFSFPMQFMNSPIANQANFPMNLPPNYNLNSFNNSNNNNNNNANLNSVMGSSNSFFQNFGQSNFTEEMKRDQTEISSNSTLQSFPQSLNSQNIINNNNNGETNTEISANESTDKENSYEENSNEQNNQKEENGKSPALRAPFTFEIIDEKMKIGIPPDYSLSGIYITTHARKVLEKYAAQCEKSYAKVTKTAEALFDELRPPKEDMMKRRELLKKIQKIISDNWTNENAKLHLFGSSANDFCLNGGDIDMCLTIDRKDDQKVEVVEELGRLLLKNEMENVMSLSGARVPIVKFTDPETGYSCDICINNTLALQNTKLLAHYSKIDPRLKKLACVIKYWAKRRQINAPFAGTLSSYAYVLLIIHFLQRRDSPILPCLQLGIENIPKVEVEGYDCTFQSNNLNTHRINGSKNKQSLGKLVIDFFKFYGLEFDYVNCVISVRTAGFFTKEVKDWKKPKHARESCFLGLEDPFEVTHNLGRVVDKRGIEIIRNEFERAFIILARKGDLKRVNKEYKEDDQDCNWR